MRVEPVGYDGVWIGQLLSEKENPKRYRVISIRSNPDQVIVRAVGGRNMRTLDRTALNLNWFPAGATLSEDRQEEK